MSLQTQLIRLLPALGIVEQQHLMQLVQELKYRKAVSNSTCSNRLPDQGWQRSVWFDFALIFNQTEYFSIELNKIGGVKNRSESNRLTDS